MLPQLVGAVPRLSSNPYTNINIEMKKRAKLKMKYIYYCFVLHTL